MAINRQKISQMTPKGSDLDPTDLLEVSVLSGFGYNTYSITGLELMRAAASLNNLYTQTASSTPVSNTTTETSLLDGGLGSLSIPADGFNVGDSFHAILTGYISSVNNHNLTIRIKAGSVVLATTGSITMAGATGRHWKLEVYFTVRTLGASGVASIATGGTFMYTKNASTNFEGTNFSTETTTGFDTTISNTLAITAQWGTANAGDSIYSEIFTLNKTY
jgi:hypothetical protein